jgi:hypothetical protein
MKMSVKQLSILVICVILGMSYLVYRVETDPVVIASTERTQFQRNRDQAVIEGQSKIRHTYYAKDSRTDPENCFAFTIGVPGPGRTVNCDMKIPSELLIIIE